jgi:hypothetical protein
MNTSVAHVASQAAWNNIVTQFEAIVGSRLVDASVGPPKRLIEPQLIGIKVDLLIGVRDKKIGHILKPAEGG